MTAPIRKKLIEVSIPLEAVNKASAREKSIRHGHPSTLHLWWARRPLAACRAVLFAQLVDDPSAWPDRFPSEVEQDAERKRLHKVIIDLVPWEASNNEEILNAARWEIARSVAWGLEEEPPAHGDGPAILAYLQRNAPPIYDPFSGGGSIPLEAQRLGLRAYGSDLNPVAVLIGKALVEIPPKFAGLSPVNLASRTQATRGGAWQGRGAEGLAEDVRYYGQWMRDEASRRIGHLYPKAVLPDGSRATVIAWLWARTVRSPDPAAKGAMVPLIGSFLLSRGKGANTWMQLVHDTVKRDGWYIKICRGQIATDQLDAIGEGTVGRKGAICALTGAPIPLSYIRDEGRGGRLRDRLIGIIADTKNGRAYLEATDEHEALARQAESASLIELEQEISHNPRDIKPPTYGMRRWKDIFTPRQSRAIETFGSLLPAVAEQISRDAAALGCGYPESEFDIDSYTQAVCTYLAFAIDKGANYWSTLCAWNANREAVVSTFGRQAIAMTWDFIETNPLSTSTGNFLSGVDSCVKSLIAAPAVGVGEVVQLDAREGSGTFRDCIVETDPPYFDNIAYAELSDFFYVWLRANLRSFWPELFRRVATPKEAELVAAPFRHGGKEAAEAYFMRGMEEAFKSIGRISAPNSLVTVFYAFKQSDSDNDGTTSAGWSTFLQGVVDSGFIVDGTWPIRTEYTGNLKRSLNVLATSVVLVCRKRSVDAPVITKADFVRVLKRELPAAIDAIRKAGVGPVDMQQSVIGPGMGVFSRNSKILEDDDSTMSVKTALMLINRVWEEIENELDAAFDPATQVALAWFATYGFDAKPSGELITLANAKNIPLDTLFSSDVFQNLHGRAGLIPRAELPRGWTPATDKKPTVWECVQYTARVLAAADGGAEAAAALVGQMGRMAADARTLAYRLFEIATKKGWAAEALVYNELAEEWPHLEDLTPSGGAAAQADMFQELR